MVKGIQGVLAEDNRSSTNIKHHQNVSISSSLREMLLTCNKKKKKQTTQCQCEGDYHGKLLVPKPNQCLREY